MFKKLIILCTAVLATQMAFGAIFMKFEGVDGESKDKDHRAYSNVLSWSWSTDADKKSTCVKDFEIVKEIDKASPKLLMGLVNGKAYQSARFAVTTDSTSSGRIEYVIMDFKNVRISSHSISSSEDDIPVESLSISFEEVTYTYVDFDERGQSRERVEAVVKSKGKC